MLATLLQAIQPTLLRHNSKPPACAPIPRIDSSFVGAGAPTRNKRTNPNRPSLLDRASDWKLLVDFQHKPYLFPPHIIATSERPDILLYSNSLRMIIFGELTCPAEEGIAEAKLRKQARYAELAETLRGLKHSWTVHVLTLEVGARGFVARSTYTFLRKIGFTATAARTTCRQVSEVAARCSFAIYLRHGEKDWNSSRALVVHGAFKEPTFEIDPSLQDKGVTLRRALWFGCVPHLALFGLDAHL